MENPAILRMFLNAQPNERLDVQHDAGLNHGGEVEFVGRPVGAELKEGELNPALQKALDKFMFDVTVRARESRIDPVFGRDNEIRQIVDILSRRRKNNPSLVGEPDDDTACLMLRGLKSRFAEHHNVHITDDALRAAVTLSRRYLTGCQLPDTAVRNVNSLLNQQILPVLSQKLLIRMAAKQKTHSLTLGWNDEEGIGLEFTHD